MNLTFGFFVITFIYYYSLCYCSYTTTIKQCAKAGINNNQRYHKFLKFVKKYNRNYKTPRECKVRLKIFKKTLKSISNIKEGYKGSAKYGITFGADFTKRDWRRRTGEIMSVPPDDGVYYQAAPRDIPVSWDWRQKGIVNPPRDQGNCGSCYAFTATGLTEMMYAKKTGKRIQLSEQQIADCDHSARFCEGGMFVNSIKYLIRSGAMLLSDYPYKDRNQTCLYDRKKVVIRPKRYALLKGDERLMAQYVYEIGPIAVFMTTMCAKFYKSGIIFDLKHTDRDPGGHGVIIVGYGVETFPDKTNIPYWIIRNSWGTKYGEKGYFRLARGFGMCNITVNVASVEV